MIFDKAEIFILFLEDSKKDIEIVHQILLDDFDCALYLDSAATEEEFIHNIQSKKYDVILADYTLPGFNAEEALKQAMSICPDTPFICVSGTIGEEIAVELLHQGAADYVLKDRMGRLSFSIIRAIDNVEKNKEKKNADIQLKRYSEFQDILLNLAKSLICVPIDAVDGSITSAMGIIGEYFHFDLASIGELNIHNSIMSFQHAWIKEGFSVDKTKWQTIPLDCIQERIDFNFSEPFFIKSSYDLPKGVICQRIMKEVGIKSLYFFPLINGKKLYGGLFFGSLTQNSEWDKNVSIAGQLFSSILISVLTRKEQEKTLFEISQSNQLMLNSTSDGIAMYDMDGNVLRMNAAFLNRPGVPDHVNGKDMRLLMPAVAEQRYKKLRQVCETGEPLFFEDERDGIFFWNRYYPVLKDGNVTAVTLFSTNITDTKNAEKEARRAAELQLEAEILRKKEKEYLEILDGSTEASWIYDFEHGTLKYPAEWKRRIGAEYVLDEDMNLYTMTLLHPDDVRKIACDREAIYEAKLTKYKNEYRFKINTGEYIWVYDQGKIVYGENGDPIKIYGTSMDISDRKQAEETLRENNAKLEAVFESMGDAVSVSDINGNFIDFNEGFVTYHRFGNKEECFKTLAKYMDYIDVYFEDGKLAPLDMWAVSRALRGEKGFNARYKLKRKDTGEVWWGSYSFAPILDKDGKIAGSVVVGREITEKMRLEETVRQNELLLKTIIQSASDLLFINDSEGRVVFVNDAYKIAFSIDPKDVVGKNANELYRDEEYARTIKESDRKVMRTGESIVSEEIAQTHDGILSTFLVTKSPWRDGDGNIVGVVGVAHDITDRKQAEEALKLAKDLAENQMMQLNAVLENMTEGVIVTDAKGKVLSMNAASLRMHGMRSIDDCSDYTIDIESFSLDGRPLLPEECPIGRAVKGETFTNYEISVCRKGVDIKWIGSYGGAPIYDKNGDIRMVIITFRDITQQKEMDLELERAMDQLKIADRNKSEFISILSHELRNPLAAISAGLQIFESTQNAYQISKAKEIINRQMKQLCKLVDDLLDVTRFIHQKIKLKKEIININEVVRNTIEDIKAEYNDKDIKLGTKILKRPILLNADPIRITQMIGNVLSNAFKFTPNGGVVWLSLKQVKNEAVIKIQDNGKGISPEILPQIFDPFTQAEQTLGRQNGGLGLGLSIVRGIAELHGGSVSAYSAGSGKGSEFIIHLPIPDIEDRGE